MHVLVAQSSRLAPRRVECSATARNFCLLNECDASEMSVQCTHTTQSIFQLQFLHDADVPNILVQIVSAVNTLALSDSSVT